jgi:putative transposase
MYRQIDERPSAVAVVTMCELLEVPRSGYYRSKQSRTSISPDPLMAEVHAICTRMPRYGYRRVKAQLSRQGIRANGKKVLRIMRQEKLLCKPKKRWHTTTDSRHSFRRWPNITSGMAVTGPNQLWVSDISYVRLGHGFMYLAVIIDVYSRRAVGWAMSRRLDTQLALSALRRALARRKVPEGLVHHSDQGVQYASQDYVALLQAHRITISMSRTGNPYDNAYAESFIKTLKHEEVHINEYESFKDAEHQIDRFIGRIYNKVRLHSSIGYRTPVEYEAMYYYSQQHQQSHLNNRALLSQ